MIGGIFKRKKAPAPAELTPEQVAGQLRATASQLECETRIEKAVQRYGRAIERGSTKLQDAFATIADCLEQGADALEARAKKVTKK